MSLPDADAYVLRSKLLMHRVRELVLVIPTRRFSIHALEPRLNQIVLPLLAVGPPKKHLALPGSRHPTFSSMVTDRAGSL